MCRNDQLILSFLKKSILGQKTNANDSEAVIKECISLAYSDMLTAGKYYLDANLSKGDKQKTLNNNERKEKFYEILERRNFVFSRELIKETCEIFGTDENLLNSKSHATRYGLAQKVVNMTFKYLYVFSAEIDRDINFSNCDCPLDSIIISGKLGFGREYIWSKLNEEDYIELQNEIDAKVRNESEYRNLGRLLFDFLNW